jgi:hypothetical protein
LQKPFSGTSAFLLFVLAGSHAGDELDASFLEIAEERVLVWIARFSGRLLVALPKEKSSRALTAAASPRRRRAAARRERVRHARPLVVVPCESCVAILAVRSVSSRGLERLSASMLLIERAVRPTGN